MLQEACTVQVSSFDLSKAVTFSGIFSKIKLSPSARLVLRCLVDFWNPSKGLVFPGQKKIAEYTGSSDKSITNAVNELRKENLILTSGPAGGKLKYFFTPKFFELVKIAESPVKNAEDTTVKITVHEQKKHEQNIKQINNNQKIIILSNGFKVKTDFQREYIDVFENLTPVQIDKYKLLEGFEREKWLIKKRQEFRKQNEIKQINESAADISELVEFQDRQKALEHCATTFKLSPKMMSNNSLSHKIADHWGFTDQDIRKYLLYDEI